MKIKIGFIGIGNMGNLLLKQMKLLDNNLIKFCIFDRNQHKLEQNCSGYNVIVCNSELELIQKSHIIFLCVKPNEYDDLLIKIKNFNPNIIVVNITIGYPLKRMIEILGNENSKVVRVMPSTTMVTKKSVTGWTYKNWHQSKSNFLIICLSIVEIYMNCLKKKLILYQLFQAVFQHSYLSL